MFTALRAPTTMRLLNVLRTGDALLVCFTDDDLCRENFQLFVEDDDGHNVVVLVQYIFQNGVWLFNCKEDGQWGSEMVKTCTQLGPGMYVNMEILLNNKTFHIGVNFTNLVIFPTTVSPRLGTRLRIAGPVELQSVVFVTAECERIILFDNEVGGIQGRSSHSMRTKPSDSHLAAGTSKVKFDRPSLARIHSSMTTAKLLVTPEPPAEGHFAATPRSSDVPPASPPKTDSSKKAQRFSAGELTMLKEKAASAFEELRMRRALRNEVWKQQYSRENSVCGPSSSMRTLTPSRAACNQVVELDGSDVTPAVKSVTFFDSSSVPRDALSKDKSKTVNDWVSEFSIELPESEHRPEPVEAGSSDQTKLVTTRFSQDAIVRETRRDSIVPDKEIGEESSVIPTLMPSKIDAKGRRISNPIEPPPFLSTLQTLVPPSSPKTCQLGDEKTTRLESTASTYYQPTQSFVANPAIVQSSIALEPKPDENAPSNSSTPQETSNKEIWCVVT